MEQRNADKFSKFFTIYIIIEIIFLLSNILYKLLELPNYAYNPGNIFMGLFLLLGIIGPAVFSLIFWRYGRWVHELVEDPHERGKIHRAFDPSFKEIGITSWRASARGIQEAWSIVEKYEAKSGTNVITQYRNKIKKRVLLVFLNSIIVISVYIIVSIVFIYY
jgi:hypothetical protein